MRIALLSTGRHDIACLTAIAKRLPDVIWCHYPQKLCANDMEATANSVGCMGWATAFLHLNKVDALVVVGDRTETLAACVAAVCMKVRLIHISGGEVTTGAIDNVCRHAISQLAELHFVSHEQAAAKLRYMGVPGDIHVVGAPALDALIAKGLKHKPGVDIVMIYHPTTLGTMTPLAEIQAVVEGIRPHVRGKVIMCGANPDAGGSVINDFLKTLGEGWEFRPSMSPDEYWVLLSTAACLVGNSSSGIVEAPVIGVPVVNIGERQGGRLRAGTVWECPCDAVAIRRAVGAAIQAGTAIPSHTYGDGLAGSRIASVLS